ncbi:patatin-like phospholipase family protein [Shewanella sp. Isolate11]|uniref:patatin-like phospholipase family protein n=1 Tax=Shewanella sp. Isolate11 TaxID=2908530 RepID=UPI001EFD6E66|nr:patatin-like phospholipase family protein [Shewanella sp. Isolate11]MCG9698261.1 patatin-like phospholipase family protein [Shewanella sp. Isolate11]
MKRFFVLCLCWSYMVAVSAAEVRPKVGLALSGGGAKGAAHIAVLKALEENHIPVDYIAGTSIGAFVAGMYALGYSASEIETIMMGADWDSGYYDTIPRASLSYRDKQQRDRFNIPINVGYSDNEMKTPSGLLRGQTMSLLLQNSTDLVHRYEHFDQLAIPYRAVATDLETSKAVVMSRGSLVEAMQASATVPGALQPAEYEGKLVVDGGIANNMPVDIVKEMGADIVIAVDIGSSLVPREQLQSTVAVLNQLSTMLTNASTERQKLLLTDTDILIRPDVGEMSTTDFSVMPEAYRLGEEATLAQIDKLKTLSLVPEAYAAYQAHKTAVSLAWKANVDKPVVEIRFKNNSKVSATLLRETLGIKEGEVVDKATLEQGINNVYALDKFERVNAEFIDTDEGRVLVLDTQAKSWGPNYFQLGFSWEDNFSLDSYVALDVAYVMTDLTQYGGEWRNAIRLGFEKLLSSEFYLPLDPDQRFFARTELSYSNKDWPLYSNNVRVLNLDQTNYRADLGIGMNYIKEGVIEVGVTTERGDLENAIFTENLDYSSYGAYLKFGFDNLDSINFPTSGNRITLDFYYRKDQNPSTSGKQEPGTSLQVEANWRGALSFKNHAFVGMASLATVDDEPELSVHVAELGGFLNLSGYHKKSLVGPHKVFGAFIYQYDLGRDMLGMTDYPLYLGTSFEAGNIWMSREEVNLGDLIYGGSVYFGTDTSVGPAALGFGWADDGEKSIFLFLGKNW